jgi:hypothetical protein
LDALLRARGWGEFSIEDCENAAQAHEKLMATLRRMTENFGRPMPDNVSLEMALELFELSLPPAKMPERPRQSFQDWAAGLPMDGGFELPQVR